MNQEQIENLPENERMILENVKREQIEFFEELDSDKRMRLLLVLRGKEINKLQNDLAILNEDVSRERRAMSHKLAMNQKEQEETKKLLDEALERERFLQAENQKSIRLHNENKNLIEKLKRVNYPKFFC